MDSGYDLTAALKLEQNLIRQVDEAGSPLELWTLALRESDHFTNVRSRPYWHANGFFRFVLFDDSGRYGETLRLHYWPRQALADAAGTPHNHSWDFASYVCSGMLRVIRFVEAEPDVHNRRSTERWTVGSSRNQTVESGDRVELRISSEEILSPPATHVSPANLVHKVESLTPSVTLVLQGPHIRDVSDVFGAKPNAYSVPYLSQTQIEQCADEISALLPSAAE